MFDSSQIPGEIIDLLVINTKVLADNPALGKALVGAWYEIMGIMQGMALPQWRPALQWGRPRVLTWRVTRPRC